MVCVANDILRCVDEKKAVLLVLLDLSAAFDTVDHVLLDNMFTQLFSKFMHFLFLRE